MRPSDRESLSILVSILYNVTINCVRLSYKENGDEGGKKFAVKILQ